MTHDDALTKARELGLSTHFICWLQLNWPIWDEFVVLARKVRDRGRPRWSARAIIHVLRWNRIVRDATDPTFKINNNWTPNMARLYNGLVGFDFFQEREKQALDEETAP